MNQIHSRHISTRSNPVNRALVARNWERGALDAQLHALIGESGSALISKAGRIFYVVISAAATARMHSGDKRIVALTDAISAVHDQVGDDAIPPERRGRVVEGLKACAELCTELTQRQITDAVLNFDQRVARQGILFSDFMRIAATMPA